MRQRSRAHLQRQLSRAPWDLGHGRLGLRARPWLGGVLGSRGSGCSCCRHRHRHRRAAAHVSTGGCTPQACGMLPRGHSCAHMRMSTRAGWGSTASHITAGAQPPPSCRMGGCWAFGWGARGPFGGCLRVVGKKGLQVLHGFRGLELRLCLSGLRQGPSSSSIPRVCIVWCARVLLGAHCNCVCVVCVVCVIVERGRRVQHA